MNETVDALKIYESIFAQCSAFVYRCHNDRDYTMQYMSGQVEEICGYPASAIINNAQTSFVALTHADDQDRVFAIVDEAVEQRKPWNMLYRLVRKTGEAAWIRERGSAVFDENGELIFLQGLIVEASVEVEVRQRVDAMADKTKRTNAEILNLTERILRTEKHLAILSVNAGIEAARAGDAGRGFAIIAQEIKARVDENASWASEIADRMQ
jgi:PAS domain S-box-containing protein